MDTPLDKARPPEARWTKRRTGLFLLTMSPVVALLVLLAWGLVSSGGNPGGLLEHNESGEVAVAFRAAPEFTGLDFLTGQRVNNVNVRGNVVMVDFFSSWCVACRVEAAELAEVYREYEGMPVDFVGVAIWDETGDILRHLDRYNVTYPNILDEVGRTAVAFGVRGVPEKFFLDRDGNILRKINGPVSQEQLREVIDGLLES